MFVDACKRPSCPHSSNSKFVGALKIALKTQLGQNCVPTSNVALSSPGSTCTNPFALGLPAGGRLVASTTTAAALAVTKTHLGVLTSPNVHRIAPGTDGQDNIANPTSCSSEPWGVLRRSQGGSRLDSEEDVSCQGTAVTSLMSTTLPLTYSSVVTGVPEMCYCRKSADSKWFAPEIRGSSALIRLKVVINDKRRGMSRPESWDSPSRWLPFCATRFTHRITLTPIPGTAQAAGRSPHSTVRGRDAPPHTPHADIRNSPQEAPCFVPVRRCTCRN